MLSNMSSMIASSKEEERDVDTFNSAADDSIFI